MSRWILCEGSHSSQLILSYFIIICAESSYRLKWIPIELLRDHIHLRFNVSCRLVYLVQRITLTLLKYKIARKNACCFAISTRAISDRRFSLYLIAILRIQLRFEYLNSLDLKNKLMDLRGLLAFSVNFELF